MRPPGIEPGPPAWQALGSRKSPPKILNDRRPAGGRDSGSVHWEGESLS